MRHHSCSPLPSPVVHHRPLAVPRRAPGWRGTLLPFSGPDGTDRYRILAFVRISAGDGLPGLLVLGCARCQADEVLSLLDKLLFLETRDNR